MKEYKKLTLRLSEKQYRHLKKNAKAAGMKMEPYMRDLIMGYEVKPHPPEAYKEFLRELSAIGNNINQIAHVANAQQNISTRDNYEAIRLVGEAMRIIKEAF